MSTARLSSGDFARIESVSRLLLSPLACPDLGAWTGSVTAELIELIGADKAVFVLEDRGVPVWHIDGDYRLDVAAGYGTYMSPEDPLGIWRRQVTLGAFRRSDLYSPAVYRSSYYHDWIVPARAYDSVGLSMEVGPERDRAFLWAHHDRPTGARFGDRGYGLVMALLAAFRVGVEMRVRLAGHRDCVATFIDALADALILLDRDGRVLHRNRSVCRLLAADPYADRLGRAVAGHARAVAALLDGRMPGSGGVALPDQMARTPYAWYRLSAFAPPTDFGNDGLVMVRVERTDAASNAARASVPDASCLRRRFGLTRREVIVARLLAERQTNAEIASALSISPHTARRHTERVREKLEVRSRFEVAARLATCPRDA